MMPTSDFCCVVIFSFGVIPIKDQGVLSLKLYNDVPVQLRLYYAANDQKMADKKKADYLFNRKSSF